MGNLKIKISVLLIFFLLFSLVQISNATDYSGTDFVVKDPVLDSGQKSSTSSSFNLGQSVSQTAIGKSTSTSFQLWSGFQYFFTANSNTLAATAGNGQVSLSWSVPQTFLGVQVGGYEVGVGTSPGVLVYENVGNVTSFVKTGLSNGTLYYFKVKAKTTGGFFLVFSNQTSATPTGSIAPGGGGGGGGGSSYPIVFSGLAYPNAKVYLLKDSQLQSEVIADSEGVFSINTAVNSSGSFSFALYAQDIKGLRSNFLTVLVNVNSGTTSVTDLILPPTIYLDKTEVKKGDVLKLLGFSAPNADLAVNISGIASEQLTTKSNSLGEYVLELSTSSTSLGKYFLQAKTIIGNLSSIFSQKLSFLVGTENVPTPEIGQCPQRADFNNDCRVNLIDFSILAFWFKKTSVPKEIDLNSDAQADLIDFSILAYYWTG